MTVRRPKTASPATLTNLREERAALASDLPEIERSLGEELQQLAGQEALGEVDATTAARQRAKADRTLADARERAQVLDDAIADVERRVAEAEEERHREELRDTAKRLSVAVTGRHGAARALAGRIRDLQISADELLRHRGIAAEAAVAFREALAPDDEFAWPDENRVDEAWSISGELLDFLDAGPIQPIATTAHARARAVEANSRQLQEQLSWLRRSTSPGDVRRLRDELLRGRDPDGEAAETIRRIADEHLTLVEAGVAKMAAKRKQRERERAAPRV